MMHQDPLNLRSLPQVSPTADNWPAIEAALTQHQSRRKLWKMAGGVLAVAASVALTAGLILQQPGGLPTIDNDSVQNTTAQAEAKTAAGPGNVTTDSLISLSQRLETNLRRMRSDIGGLPTLSLIYQVELEDLVAQVDEELSMNPDSSDLWTQRVTLLLDLSQLYRNELRRESINMASL